MKAKQQELDALRALAHELGPDSYVGPWLLDQIPAIEADIRADYPPLPDWKRTREILTQEREALTKDNQALLAQACREADQIRANAEQDAADIRAKALRDVDRLRAQARNAAHDILAVFQ